MANILAVGGPNSKYSPPGAKPAGFWAGLWHGLIAPITFIIGLITLDVRLYEAKNNGRWYDFGFVLGVSASLGSGTASR
ncbi:MAG: hypothetical protein L3K26_08460 [Candidatus Hydrogenedentes bacterium]|nr:hypothetical protein [Candidatus Hydrogenedentota bacterium]